MKTCGDFGGVARGGGPCGRRVKNGPCPTHNEAGLAELGDAKTEFLVLYGSGTTSLQAAGAAVGKSPATLWRMRQDDPVFDRAVVAVQAAVDAVRAALVEDSLFARIIKGDASAAETIFFLVNRSKGRWRHVQHVKHSGQVVGLVAFVQGIPDAEVRRIKALPEDDRPGEIQRLALESGLQLVD